MNRIILFTSASSFYIFSSAHLIFEFSLDIYWNILKDVCESARELRRRGAIQSSGSTALWLPVLALLPHRRVQRQAEQ